MKITITSPALALIIASAQEYAHIIKAPVLTGILAAEIIYILFY